MWTGLILSNDVAGEIVCVDRGEIVQWTALRRSNVVKAETVYYRQG